jgi:hypothetical protein
VHPAGNDADEVLVAGRGKAGAEGGQEQMEALR